MSMDAYAAEPDNKTTVLARLVCTLAEDAMFGLAAGGGPGSLDGLGKRRAEAYAAIIAQRNEPKENLIIDGVGL